MPCAADAAKRGGGAHQSQQTRIALLMQTSQKGGLATLARNEIWQSMLQNLRNSVSVEILCSRLSSNTRFTATRWE